MTLNVLITGASGFLGNGISKFAANLNDITLTVVYGKSILTFPGLHGSLAIVHCGYYHFNYR